MVVAQSQPTTVRNPRGGGALVVGSSSSRKSNIRWLTCPFLILAVVGYFILYSSMENHNANGTMQKDIILPKTQQQHHHHHHHHPPADFLEKEEGDENNNRERGMVMEMNQERAAPPLESKNADEKIKSTETAQKDGAVTSEHERDDKGQKPIEDQDKPDQDNAKKDDDDGGGDPSSRSNAEDLIATKVSEKSTTATTSILDDDDQSKEKEAEKEREKKQAGGERDEEAPMMKADPKGKDEEGGIALYDINKDSISQQQQQRQSTTQPIKTSTTTTTWNQPSEEDLVKLQDCFPLNSKEWLQGPRHGNINHHREQQLENHYKNTKTKEGEKERGGGGGNDDDAYLHHYDEILAKMILFSGGTHQQDTTASSTKYDGEDAADIVLQRSMCLKESRFRNVSDPLTDDRSIQLWIVRLTYLAMHKVQHQFAVPEAQQRSLLSKECQQVAAQYQIGPFDYECPEGKFFVLPVENLGLGAIMRTNVYSGLLAALSTNRPVLFVNNFAPSNTTDNIPKPIQQPWYHASCDRYDTQCFFQPPTPCVLTHAELQKRRGDYDDYAGNGGAIVMNEFRNVTKLFKNPERMMEEEWFNTTRTIILPLKTITRKVSRNVPDILRNYTIDFAERLSSDDPRQEVLAKVADRFVSSIHRDKVNQLISYGLVFYAMRPHFSSQQQLQQVLDNVIPPTKSHPEITLGLPIRASDKCIEESECLTFEQYMRVLGQIWNRHKTNLTRAMKHAGKLQVVVTSESASVIQEKDAFLANESLVKKVPFPFEIVTNDFDIQQDTGNPQFNVPELNLDVVLEKNNADQVMLSMMSSLQTQLMARHSIGNCCSNFHRLLFELLDGGCGAAYQSDPECLHKNKDPEFRICCLWDKREECKERKVRETIEKKWAAVKRRRMAERMRRRQGQQAEPQDEDH